MYSKLGFELFHASFLTLAYHAGKWELDKCLRCDFGVRYSRCATRFWTLFFTLGSLICVQSSACGIGSIDAGVAPLIRRSVADSSWRFPAILTRFNPKQRFVEANGINKAKVRNIISD